YEHNHAPRRRSAPSRSSERLRRPRLLDLCAALLTSSPRVVIPEVEHRLAEVLDDVPAVEVDVFHECSAFGAIENNVFMFACWATALDAHANRVWGWDRCGRDIGWDEECFSLTDQVIDDSVALVDTHF